jgi:hypothetical protein
MIIEKKSSFERAVSKKSIGTVHLLDIDQANEPSLCF